MTPDPSTDPTQGEREAMEREAEWKRAWKTRMNELHAAEARLSAYETALRELDEDALFATLHDFRRCSEEQARGIISAYLTARSAVLSDLPRGQV